MNSENGPTNPAPDDNDKNKILVDQIKENYLRYVDNVWKTIQFLVVAIGWLLTSSNAKATIASSRLVQIYTSIVILALFLGHVFVEIRFLRDSQRIAARIRDRMGCQVASDTKLWQVHLSLVSINTCLIFVLFLFVFIIVIKSPTLAP